jgi:hypothetical protein
LRSLDRILPLLLNSRDVGEWIDALKFANLAVERLLDRTQIVSKITARALSIGPRQFAASCDKRVALKCSPRLPVGIIKLRLQRPALRRSIKTSSQLLICLKLTLPRFCPRSVASRGVFGKRPRPRRLFGKPANVLVWRLLPETPFCLKNIRLNIPPASFGVTKLSLKAIAALLRKLLVTLTRKPSRGRCA